MQRLLQYAGVICVALMLGAGLPGAVAAEPPCVSIGSETVRCVGVGAYSYSFSVTNQSSLTVAHLAFVDMPGDVVVTPPVVTLLASLTNGAATTVTVLLSNAFPTNLCFRLAAHTMDFSECCVTDHCVPLPACCLALSGESLRCSTNNGGSLAYTLTVQNLDSHPAHYVSLVSPDGYFSFEPPIIALATPLAFGQSTNLTVMLQTSPACGTNLCFLVALHGAFFEQCCAIEHCLVVDATPPDLHCPSNLVVEGQGGAGTPVSFAVTAADNLDPAPTVVCTPPSGSSFPPGVTEVACLARDRFCNTTRCTFTVELRSRQVTGHIALEAFVGPAHNGQGTRAVVFTATDNATNILAVWTNTLSFVTGGNGYGVVAFTLAPVPGATTHLSAKTAWNLRKRLPLAFTNFAAVAEFTGMHQLPGGDIHSNDNRVDVNDYFQLAASWYQVNGVSDINGSGLVEIDDYFILASHWYEQGDAP